MVSLEALFSRIHVLYIWFINFFIVFPQGQGYSLSADIQYVDARWEIPVVLPLHDCTSQELNLLCHLDGFVIQTFSYFIQDSLLCFIFFAIDV